MKATGMVRRIDDLGRIVIPKEVRRTLRICKGDPLELYIDAGGNIVFKKYSLLGELSKVIDCCCETLYKIIGLPVVICNKEQVIAVCGLSKKECLGRRVSAFMLDSLPFNKSTIFLNKDEDSVQPIEGLKKEAFVVSPVNQQGDLIGLVIILKNNLKSNFLPEIVLNLADAISMFLGRLVE